MSHAFPVPPRVPTKDIGVPTRYGDSRALYYSDGLGGPLGNWVDRSALQGARRTQTDENHHLAKVALEMTSADRRLQILFLRRWPCGFATASRRQHQSPRVLCAPGTPQPVNAVKVCARGGAVWKRVERLGAGQRQVSPTCHQFVTAFGCVVATFGGRMLSSH
jgi:hypothetical protein